MWLWNWIINSIPLWAWIALAGTALIATYSLWGPVWAMLPTKVKVVLIGIATLGGAYLAGRYKGAHDERAIQKARQREALQKRQEVDHAVDGMPTQEVDTQLDKWTRP